MRYCRFLFSLMLCLNVCLCGCWSTSMEKLGLKKSKGELLFFYKDNYAVFLWPLPPLGVGWSSLRSFPVEENESKVETLQRDFFFFVLLNPMYPTVIGEKQIKVRDEGFKRKLERTETGVISLYPFTSEIHRPVFYLQEYLFFYPITEVSEIETVLLWKKDETGYERPLLVYSNGTINRKE